jgi:hypothetical protein
MLDRVDPLAAVLRRGFVRMVRSGLRGLWVRGTAPPAPFVWAANHHSWWDPFVAAAVLGRRRERASLLMAQENLETYGFARRLGVFGTAEHRRGLTYLAAGRALVLFPEGEMRPPGPLGPFADGASWYAKRAGVPLCAVAAQVVMRGHQAPEAYLSFVDVPTAGPVAVTTARLAQAIGTELLAVAALAERSDPRAPLPGFEPVIRGRRSWDERIDRVSSWPPWAS